MLTNVIFRGSVTAKDDYAGGLIGRSETTNGKVRQEDVVNCLVIADIHTPGENASFWINDTSSTGDAGSAYIYIYENSTLNGQTAKSVVAAANAAGKANYVTPVIRNADQSTVDLLVTDETLNTKDFYNKTLKVTAANWKLDHIGTDGNKYMPFTTMNSSTTSVLYYVNHDIDGNEAGIRLPVGAVGKETVVYASGINTVNIETGTPNTSVTVKLDLGDDGTTFTTDADGVLTLYYDFKTDFFVNDLPYYASDLARKVMTYRSNVSAYWYYIDKDGNIKYGLASGTADEMKENADPVQGVSNAVHLWRGFAMDSSGNVYNVPAGTASALAGVTAANNLTKTNTKSFWDDGTVSVYYYFTRYSGTTVPYRVFMLGETPYAITPGVQNVVYDSVVLSSKVEFGAETRYFALLNEESGSFEAYLAPLSAGILSNSGIKYSSNNLGYDGQVLLAYYEDGSVIGIDYSSGATVVNYSPTPMLTSFFKYVRNTLASTLGGSSGKIATNGSYVEGEALFGTLKSSGVLGGDTFGTARDSTGTSTGDGTITGGGAGGAGGSSGETDVTGEK
ncbi:MAG: hypothetical protein KBS59_06035, partial [Clostridiales bacterium]|nr:hypothetical protein [Clostridiales bacterium]